MIFDQSWRWYGPNDPISLEHIKQAGAHGIVTALHHIPVGEVWPIKEIEIRKASLAESNTENSFALNWNVVESLPVHENIKQGKPDRDIYIEKYKESLKNLAICGVNTVCYNFMPVLDWLRTNVNYKLEDGSLALLHNIVDLAIFDLFILKREKAEAGYPKNIIMEAKEKYSVMPDSEKETLRNSLLMALPGDKEGFTLEKLRLGLAAYSEISEDNLRENLIYFLKAVIPTAQQLGVNMAIHPDDPPWPVLGLPRVVSKAEDLDYMFSQVPEKANGLTFCSGSLGASEENDLQAIVNKWYSRIHFVHLRSVQRIGKMSFYEANHLEGNVEMYKLVKVFCQNQLKFKGKPLPMRPDHGHQMFDDLGKTFYPGYSAIGRLRGLAELRGLEFGIVNSFKNT
jgi:mannonate dehydratase